jgi:membrane dipeptidase
VYRAVTEELSMADNQPIPIIDGHNDALLRLRRNGPGAERGFLERGEIGHLDLPRARAGGLAGGFFAVFIPNPSTGERPPRIQTDGGYEIPLPPPLDLDYAQQIAREVTDSLFALEAVSDGQIKIVRTVDDLRACLRDGVLGAILHFEGAEAIDTDLEALYDYHARGLRSLGPVWSRPTAFAHGVPIKYPSSPDSGPGLTDTGHRLVRACNELGIMLDMSHLNEAGFWDVAKLSDAPLVATHSCAHALCPHARNLTDRQLDAIRDSGGLVGVNFNVGFFRADGRPEADTPLADLARHVTYIAERIGIEHVALGSDFDGALMPSALGDAAGLPKLMDELRAQGLDDAALRQVGTENWLRVLGATWKAT